MKARITTVVQTTDITKKQFVSFVEQSLVFTEEESRVHMVNNRQTMEKLLAELNPAE